MKRSNPRIFACLLAGAVGLASMYALRGQPQDAVAKPPPVPGLWGAPAGGCPQTSRDEAEALAAERLRLAVAKHERSPFHPEDGVAAVPLYESAVACFRTAARSADADDALAMAEQLKRDTDDQFRAHRLRLQRALARENWRWAERETDVLLAFLSGSGSEYANWLSNLRRKIQLSYGSTQE
jgi:hypothetical protein